MKEIQFKHNIQIDLLKKRIIEELEKEGISDLVKFDGYSFKGSHFTVNVQGKITETSIEIRLSGFGSSQAEEIIRKTLTKIIDSC